MDEPMDAPLAHLEQQRDRYLDELFELLRIPSVSAQGKHADDVRAGAEWVRARLEAAGLEAGIHEDDAGLPLVYGRYGDDPARKTVLLYGHYDVQPPEPLELWDSPPFEPTVRDGVVYARGCADDKGPTLAMIQAAECWIAATGELPVNLRVVIEGEEEVGGSVIGRYLERHKDAVAADAIVIADVPGAAPGVPAFCYGLRGFTVLEFKVTGPSRDLHSGTYGGTVANPLAAAARLVASLHDAEGRVAVDGFYDGVQAVDDAERARVAEVPFDEDAHLEETGSPALFGEPGFSTLERKGARPTCEVNGLFGGYQGEGAKTIVPAEATCKITCRLVPDQDPVRVQDAVVKHLEARCPPGVRLEITRGTAAEAVFADPTTPWAQAACHALEKAYGKAPVLVREGGSIPVAITFQELFGHAPLLLGTYSPGERAHSPNERYPVADFFGAIRTGIALYGNPAG